MGRIEQCVALLHKLWRLRSHDLRQFIKESLRARHERRIGGHRHLPGNCFLRYVEPRPMIVGQPKRHLDMQNIKEFNEVIRPTRRDCARTHGVLERKVPADNPRNQLAERSVSIGVGAAR